MEGSSEITEKIHDTKHIDNHPGTMNFKQRLNEAQKIHQRNIALAARLDTIKPYYGPTGELSILKHPPVSSTNKKKTNKLNIINPKKSKFAKELAMVMKLPLNDHKNGGHMTNRSENDATEYKNHMNHHDPYQSQSARDYIENEEYSNNMNIDNTYNTSTSQQQQQRTTTRPNNVLLEYTKIQDGRVLDIAVLKEPFRDSYAIFGIDVDDGQRYQLRLTSDEVSSILDGDILVTSVDNIEVWMALLNKVNLHKVNAFAKLSFSGDEVDKHNKIISNNNQSQNHIHTNDNATITTNSNDNYDNINKTSLIIPIRPSGSRRSKERPISREYNTNNSNTNINSNNSTNLLNESHSNHHRIHTPKEKKRNYSNNTSKEIIHQDYEYIKSKSNKQIEYDNLDNAIAALTIYNNNIINENDMNQVDDDEDVLNNFLINDITTTSNNNIVIQEDESIPNIIVDSTLENQS